MASSQSREEIDDKSLEEKEKPRIITSSNWKINNGRNFDDCVSTIALSQAQDKTNLEDVVTFDTCVALEFDPSGESCIIEFKVLNSFKIVRIAVVSEACVLEFFKQSGEYATTAFAEFVDEFQDHVVYFAEARIHPPSTEASIKFTRTKSKGPAMWIYGIKLVMNDVVLGKSQNMTNPDLIRSLSEKGMNLDVPDTVKKFLESYTLDGQDPLCNDWLYRLRNESQMGQLSKYNVANVNGHFNDSSNNDHGDTESKSGSVRQDCEDLKMYIDDKISGLERRLMTKIETHHQDISEKLDQILTLMRASDPDN